MPSRYAELPFQSSSASYAYSGTRSKHSPKPHSASPTSIVDAGAMAPRRFKGKQKASNSQDDITHSGSSDGSQSVAKSKQPSTHCQWTVQDEEALIELALLRKTVMGNGSTFKDVFWNEVASNFPPPTHGKPKTMETCREKWKRMKSIYDIIDKIANTSGLAYSLDKGADIGLESQHVWDGIVKNTKGAGRFKNKGWVHYDKMKLLLPSRSKGTHKFTAQNTPTLPSSTSQSSVSSPSLATHQTTSQSASGEGSSSEGRNTTINLNTIGTIALPAATVAANYRAK
ncbi:hypothetical protein V8E55_008764 [Tylopilus felleus]